MTLRRQLNQREYIKYYEKILWSLSFDNQQSYGRGTGRSVSFLSSVKGVLISHWAEQGSALIANQFALFMSRQMLSLSPSLSVSLSFSEGKLNIFPTIKQASSASPSWSKLLTIFCPCSFISPSSERQSWMCADHSWCFKGGGNNRPNSE